MQIVSFSKIDTKEEIYKVTITKQGLHMLDDQELLSILHGESKMSRILIALAYIARRIERGL